MDLALLSILLWLIAGLASFYFSLGNARVWTSITIGFALIFFAEVTPSVILQLPALQIPQLQALSQISGTLAILMVTLGFLEYYMFSRALEVEGEKLHVYLGALSLLIAAMIIVFFNPPPTPEILHTLNIVENSCWVFLSLINIDVVRKISLAVKGTPIFKGFIGFFLVFSCILLWKGSELYLQVYDLVSYADQYPWRYELSRQFHEIGNYLASISVAGTFIYLSRLLR